MMPLRYQVRLFRCALRLLAALATGNGTAAWNTFCDVEDIHAELGHGVQRLDRSRPWSG
jgi:hypothetical protein